MIKKNILIARNSGGLGDMIMLTSTIKQIKLNNPNSNIIVCTTPLYRNGILVDVLHNNIWIDKVITTSELIDYNFSKVYNYNTGQERDFEKGQSYKNRIDTFAEFAGVKLKDKKPVYIVTKEEKEWAKAWIEVHIPKNRRTIIGMQTSATEERRNWPTEKQHLLALNLTNKWKDISVVFFNDEVIEVQPKFPNIYTLTNLPIRRSIALLNECRLLVLPDSGLLHVAGALDKPTLALFGCNPPESRIKYYKNMESIWLEYPCWCWYEKCDHNYRCMWDISVADVFDRVERILERDEKNIKSVMLLRMGGLGDIVLLSSAINAYKEKYPDRRLILATKNVDIATGNPNLSEVIHINDAHKKMADKIIDLRYKVEPPQINGTLPKSLYDSVDRSDLFERLLDVKSKKKKFYVNIDESVLERVKSKIEYSKEYKYVGLQVSCTARVRSFPTQYVHDLVRLFDKEKKTKVVLIGVTEAWDSVVKKKLKLQNIQRNNVINLIDKLDTLEMTALIKVMDVFIGPDSGLLHIAGALGKPSIGVFGNIDPILRTKYYKNMITLFPKGKLKCIPCGDIHPCGETKVGGRCMRLIFPETIFYKYRHLHEKRSIGYWSGK